jgi:predicted nucleotidyltransferase
MAENPHYKELLQLLNEFKVRFLVVGGYAVMKYSEPRYTKDLDLWVENSRENSSRLFEALKKFGAPLDGDRVTAETFTDSSLAYQIGVAPLRVDILTGITGLDFPAAWENRVHGTLFGAPVFFISLNHLIQNKQAVGRSSDLAQLEHIAKLHRKG